MTTLLRHEYLRTRPLIGLVLGAMTLFAAVGVLLQLTPWTAVGMLGFLLAIMAVVGCVPVITLALAVDYWRSAYGRLGYLTQTLPVPGGRIYRARLFYGALVMLVATAWTLVVGGALAVVRLRDATPAGTSTVGHLAQQVRDAAATLTPAAWAIGALLVVFVTWGYLVQLYAAASLGSESRLASLGPAGPIAVALALEVAQQALFFVAILAVPYSLGPTGGRVGIVHADMTSAFTAQADIGAMPLGFVPVLVIVTAALLWRTTVSWNHKVTLR